MNVNERFYLHTYTVTYINKVGSFFSVHMSRVARQAGVYLRFL